MKTTSKLLLSAITAMTLVFAPISYAAYADPVDDPAGVLNSTSTLSLSPDSRDFAPAYSPVPNILSIFGPDTDVNADGWENYDPNSLFEGLALDDQGQLFIDVDGMWVPTVNEGGWAPAVHSLGNDDTCNLNYGSHAYTTQTITVDETENYTFRYVDPQVAEQSILDDPFLVVYEGSFNPASADSGIIGCNDDGNVAGTTSSGSLVSYFYSSFTAQLEAGKSYTLVLSTFRSLQSDPIYSEKFGTFEFWGPEQSIAFNPSVSTIASPTEGGTAISDIEAGVWTITATPNQGFEFESWLCEGETLQDATLSSQTFAPSGDTTCTATFNSTSTDLLTVVSSTEVGGSASKTYLGSGNWSLTANSNSGYTFAGWSCDSGYVPEAPTAKNTTMFVDSTVTCTASFVAVSITTDVNTVGRYGEVAYTSTGLQYSGDGAIVALFLDETFFQVGGLGNGTISVPWAFWTAPTVPAPALGGLPSNTKLTIRYYGSEWDGAETKAWSDPYDATSDVTHLAGAGSEWFNAQPSSGGPNMLISITSFWSEYAVLMGGGASSAVFRIAGQNDSTFAVENVISGVSGTISLTSLPISGTYEVTIISSGQNVGTFTFNYRKPGANRPAVTPPNKFVTFKPNGGSGLEFTIGSNSATTLPLNKFRKTNYVFTGWNTKANGSGINLANGALYPFDSNLDLYAQWRIATSTQQIKYFENTSLKLTALMKKTISSWTKKLPKYSQISCQATTAGPRPSSKEIKFATSRAKNVCLYAKVVRPDLNTKINIKNSNNIKLVNVVRVSLG